MSRELPLAPLADWILQQGLAGSASAIAVLPLSGGQSNPTFRVTTDCGEYALRKQPPGPLLASAHAIDREYRVMAALAGTPVPVPRMLAWCDDASLLGTPFYLMEFLAGRVLADQSLPDAAPAERAAIYGEMNRVLAALHAVDRAAVGLGDYGRCGNIQGGRSRAGRASAKHPRCRCRRPCGA